jgi:HSP20 family protein
MTLASYAPFDVQLDRLFGEAVRGTTVWAPACNVYEDADRYWVEAFIPGMDPKQIDVTVEGDLLTIRGDRKEEAEEQRTYLAHEMSSGPFARSFRLLEQVDQTKASASYKDGVLRLELPKREETKPRRITIG